MTLQILSHKTDADIVKEEAKGRYSRDEETLASGSGIVEIGTVLGRIGFGARSAVSAAKAGGNTGGGTLTLDVATPVLAGASEGVWSVRLLTAAADGGVFRVTDPEGDVRGDVAVGAVFANGIKFTTADAGTDFAVGDGFDVTVATVAGSGKYKPLAPAATDGTQNAAAIILENVDATAEDRTVVTLKRRAQVVLQALVWPAGITVPQKSAALAALEAAGIVARRGV